MVLGPCAQCRRHVRLTDEACPFCKAVLSPVPTRSAVPAGRLSRAAVFAGATLAGACWTGSSAPQTTPNEHTVEQQHTPADTKPAAVAPGEIRGVVRNGSNGAPLVGARVMLQSHDTGASQQGLTDDKGEYVFSGLAPGRYVVSYPTNHPRRPPTEIDVTLQADAGQRADLSIYVPPPDRSNIPMPYGAPPARQRIV